MNPSPLTQALVRQDRDLRLLQSVVAWYADPRNWQPRPQRDADGDPGVLSNIEVQGRHRVAAEALSVIADRNPLPGGPS